MWGDREDGRPPARAGGDAEPLQDSTTSRLEPRRPSQSTCRSSRRGGCRLCPPRCCLGPLRSTTSTKPSTSSIEGIAPSNRPASLDDLNSAAAALVVRAMVGAGSREPRALLVALGSTLAQLRREEAAGGADDAGAAVALRAVQLYAPLAQTVRGLPARLRGACPRHADMTCPRHVHQVGLAPLGCELEAVSYRRLFPGHVSRLGPLPPPRLPRPWRRREARGVRRRRVVRRRLAGRAPAAAPADRRAASRRRGGAVAARAAGGGRAPARHTST